jgi:hypothetical protein
MEESLRNETMRKLPTGVSAVDLGTTVEILLPILFGRILCFGAEASGSGISVGWVEAGFTVASGGSKVSNHETEIPCTNETPQSERRRIIREGTYSAIQEAIEAESSGRFKKQTTDTGTSAYPRAALPSWVATKLPQEPPLGIDVNRVEPVGTMQEIAASMMKEEKHG